MAYRTAAHDTTGVTPAKMMMGRDLRLPIDLFIGRPSEEVPVHRSEYAQQLQSRMEKIHGFAREHLKLKSDKMKEHYDSRAADGELQEGDAAWLHNPQRKKGISPKLSRPWQGPYVVTKKINDLVYRIQLGPGVKPKVVHRNRLWKYSGRNPPTWYKQATDMEQRQSPADIEPEPQVREEESDTENENSVPNPSTEQPRRSTRTRRPPARYDASI